MWLKRKNASDPTPHLMEKNMYICTVTSTEDAEVKNLKFSYGYASSRTLKVPIDSHDLNFLLFPDYGFEKLIWKIFPNAIIKRFSSYDEWQQFTSDEYIAIKLFRKEPAEYFVVLVSKKELA